METEIGAIVELDDVLDEPELQNSTVAQLPLIANGDLVGLVRERTEVLDNPLGDQVLQQQRLPGFESRKRWVSLMRGSGMTELVGGQRTYPSLA